MQHVETVALRDVPKLLQGWLDADVRRVAKPGGPVDLVLRARTYSLAVEVKRSDDVSSIERALHQLHAYTRSHPDAVPVLAVPYMGPKAREYAHARGLSWLDLSGNADIRAPGLRILVEGKRNLFPSPGRPSTAFSPKASRVSRVMLVEPERWWLQKELAEATRLSSGFVSKVVKRLGEDELVQRRAEDGRARPRTPSLLLDAWAQVYKFSQHEVRRFHAVGRTGSAVLQELAARLSGQQDVAWAATGLAAAWHWSQFADFRLTTLFVSKPILDPEPLGLRPVERGENVWIVVPKDDGVFHGAEQAAGVICAHPVQVYLDLLGHPERAKEAAVNLRAEKLAWAS